MLLLLLLLVVAVHETSTRPSVLPALHRLRFPRTIQLLLLLLVLVLVLLLLLFCEQLCANATHKLRRDGNRGVGRRVHIALVGKLPCRVAGRFVRACKFERATETPTRAAVFKLQWSLLLLLLPPPLLCGSSVRGAGDDGRGRDEEGGQRRG